LFIRCCVCSNKASLVSSFRCSALGICSLTSLLVYRLRRSCFGHDEMDLALSSMWGKFSPAFYDAYYQVHGASAPGFDRRQVLYRLYYLLTMLVLHGFVYQFFGHQLRHILVAFTRSQRRWLLTIMLLSFPLVSFHSFIAIIAQPWIW
jgi:hypothetical protein